VQYQTFRGADVKEALTAVRTNLGPDALIGTTTCVKQGGPGKLGTNYVEIAAAAPLMAGSDWRMSTLARVDTSRAAKVVGGGRTVAQLKLEPVEVERELRVLRAMIEDLTANRPPRERALATLQAIGVEGALARQLAHGAPKNSRGNPQALREWLGQRIGAELRLQAGLIEREGSQVIACVGPTGVGKTTTLAKLAARAKLDLGRPVRVVCLDSFRVGALEQWQRYAKLMGLPLHAPTEAEEFDRIIAQSKSELVLVDTAGMATGPATWLTRIVDRPKHVLLVLPAWLRGRDTEAVLERYGELLPSALVISKLDETHQRGGVLHAALGKGCPVAYLCDGPRVPEDIRDATVDAVVQAVLNDPT
jgi:flagellar biosynthesis protein FlhF